MISELFLVCALALPPEYFYVNITPADKAFFSMIREMADEIVFLSKKNWHKGILTIRPGTIVFIQEELGELLFYFKGRDYERFPFMWKEFHIYRRRGTSA